MDGDGLTSRREALKGAARYVTLGVLAAGLGALVARPANGQCDVSSTCGGCPKFGGCSLEQAQRSRASSKK